MASATGTQVGLAALSTYLGGPAAALGGAKGLGFSNETTNTSGTRQENASGSFNYTGPLIGLPAVTGSADFWSTRGDSMVTRAGTFSVSPLLLLAGAGLAAFLFLRRR